MKYKRKVIHDQRLGIRISQTEMSKLNDICIYLDLDESKVIRKLIIDFNLNNKEKEKTN